MKEVGKRLITFRVSLGYIKQADFLQEIEKRVGPGISQGNISHWESGKYVPERAKLKLLTKAFPQLNTDWLFYGEPFKMIHNHTTISSTQEAKDAKTDRLEIEKYKLLAEFWEQKWKEDHK